MVIDWLMLYSLPAARQPLKEHSFEGWNETSPGRSPLEHPYTSHLEHSNSRNSCPNSGWPLQLEEVLLAHFSGHPKGQRSGPGVLQKERSVQRGPLDWPAVPIRIGLWQAAWCCHRAAPTRLSSQAHWLSTGILFFCQSVCSQTVQSCLANYRTSEIPRVMPLDAIKLVDTIPGAYPRYCLVFALFSKRSRVFAQEGFWLDHEICQLLWQQPDWR